MDKDFEVLFDPVSGIIRVDGNVFNLNSDEGRFAAEAFAYSVLAHRSQYADEANKILRKVEEAKKAA